MMYRKLVTPMIFIVSVTSLLLLLQINLNGQTAPPKFNSSVCVGYFQENFRWSIAGNAQGTSPNIYSELRWKKLTGPQTAINLHYNFWKNFFIQGSFSQSFITSGKITDTDFRQDNRKDTLYFDSFDSNKGNITGYDVALGYQFNFNNNFTLAPFIGYGSSYQSLYILKDFGSVTGNLRSTYQTRWNGLTIGVNGSMPLFKKIILHPAITYHQINYSAKANWNLIQEFQHPVSFRHKAKGFGLEPQLDLRYAYNRNWSFIVAAKYSYWKTGIGSDTLFLTNGDVSVTQMNGAIRNNFNIALGIQLSF